MMSLKERHEKQIKRYCDEIEKLKDDINRLV